MSRSVAFDISGPHVDIHPKRAFGNLQVIGNRSSERDIMDILHAINGAKFVQVNGRLFVNAYSCDPEDVLVDDDIVLEIATNDAHDDFTFDDVRDAQQVGSGEYRLRSGDVLCFLSPPTVH